MVHNHVHVVFCHAIANHVCTVKGEVNKFVDPQGGRECHRKPKKNTQNPSPIAGIIQTVPFGIDNYSLDVLEMEAALIVYSITKIREIELKQNSSYQDIRQNMCKLYINM